MPLGPHLALFFATGRTRRPVRFVSGEGTAAAKAAEGQLWPSRGSDSGVRYGSILVRLIRLIRLAPAIAEAKYVSPTRKRVTSATIAAPMTRRATRRGKADVWDGLP